MGWYPTSFIRITKLLYCVIVLAHLVSRCLHYWIAVSTLKALLYALLLCEAEQLGSNNQGAHVSLV